jgi:hypothetical protein
VGLLSNQPSENKTIAEPVINSSAIPRSLEDRSIRARVAGGNVHCRTFPETEVQGVEGIESDRSGPRLSVQRQCSARRTSERGHRVGSNGSAASRAMAAPISHPDPARCCNSPINFDMEGSEGEAAAGSSVRPLRVLCCYNNTMW